MAKKVTIKAPGKKSITFKEGGLHKSTHTPQSQKISPSKMQKALAGDYGPKAKKEALFKKNVLTGPKKK